MSIVYTHALNYSQLESSLVDTNIGFISEETFRNDNQQYYSPSSSSEMETMFTNSQHLAVKQEEKDPFGYTYASFLASENYDTQTKIDSSTKKNYSNLIRHNSSPAEFFSNCSLNDGTMNFSSTQSSFSINMPLILENDQHEARKNIGKCYMPSFTGDCWDGTTLNAPKTSTMNGEIIFSTSNALETQDLDFGYQKLGLSHHLSLPSSCTKMTSMDKFFHIQGSVPCKIRAKRGFATHPRSIAERERRIRISARIKKLQDLFPNSDKQSSTADMLDVAVDYIKDLRKQLKILSDTKANCTCTSSQKKCSDLMPDFDPCG